LSVWSLSPLSLCVIWERARLVDLWINWFIDLAIHWFINVRIWQSVDLARYELYKLLIYNRMKQSAPFFSFFNEITNVRKKSPIHSVPEIYTMSQKSTNILSRIGLEQVSFTWPDEPIKLKRPLHAGDFSIVELVFSRRINLHVPRCASTLRRRRLPRVASSPRKFPVRARP